MRNMVLGDLFANDDKAAYMKSWVGPRGWTLVWEVDPNQMRVIIRDFWRSMGL